MVAVPLTAAVNACLAAIAGYGSFSFVVVRTGQPILKELLLEN